MGGDPGNSVSLITGRSSPTDRATTNSSGKPGTDRLCNRRVSGKERRNARILASSFPGLDERTRVRAGGLDRRLDGLIAGRLLSSSGIGVWPPRRLGSGRGDLAVAVEFV